MDAGLVSFLVQAAATLLGALGAFELERRRRNRAERQTRISSLRTALFVSAVQRDFVLNFRNQALTPYRDRPDRPFAVREIWMTPPAARLDTERLGFLLDHHGALLQQLMMVDVKYASLLSMIAARNQLHAQCQRQLDEAYRGNGEEKITLERLGEVAGPLLATRLRQMTDELYRAVDVFAGKNADAARELRNYVGKKFPKEPLFTTEDVEREPQRRGGGAS